jgi:hypothetical protein
MEDNPLTLLKQELNELATPVGLAFAGRAEAIDETPPPVQTSVWESSFAVLALIPLSSMEVEELTSAEEIAREWMWRRLVKSEQSGNFLDGYLIFALPMKPEETMRGAVQAVELDTAVCRKHVIWPSTENNWREQLWTVTVLGLPAVERSVTTAVAPPTLPRSAVHALKLYQEIENYETTAERLREEVHTAKDEEGSNDS